MVVHLLWLIIVLLICLFLRFPVYMSLIISTVTFALAFGDVMPLEVLAQGLASGMGSVTLAGIAFFFLSGEIMSQGGIAEKIIRIFQACVGHIRGGLSHVNVLDSIVFAGTSGSAMADTVATGSIIIPAMKKAGYPGDYSMAITLATSCVGPIIPPSTGIVLLAIYTGANALEVLMAGLVPGLLMGGAMLIMSLIICNKRKYPKGEWKGIRYLLITLKETALAVLMPALIIVGLGAGIGSINEVGAAACIYGIFVSCFVYKDLDLKGLFKAIISTAKMVGRVLGINAACGIFNWIVASLRLKNLLTEIMSPFLDRQILLMFIVLAIFIVGGMFMAQSVMLYIVTPLMAPMVAAAGYSLTAYCVFAMIACTLGLITPPVGTLIYLGSSLAHEPPQRIVKELLPFIVAIVLVLILLIFFPQLAYGLPEMLYN